MEYFVEQASSHIEAQQKVRDKYGEQARIMHHRTVRLGGFLGLFTREGVEVTGYFSSQSAVAPRVPSASQSPGIERRDQRAAVSVAPAPEQQSRSGTPDRSLEEEKKKLLQMMKRGDAGGSASIESILDEIRGLRESIEHGSGSDHPAIAGMREVLERNDFTPSYTKSMLERMRAELSIAELDDQSEVHSRVLGWIADSITVYEPTPKGKPEILILVGPTGVGKTTTIAKLAAMYGLDKSRTSRELRILTIDNYRIGARQQIETYGQIMDVPVSFVESAEDMKKYLALYEDADLVFVDTIGKSPRDFRKLGEMNEMLALCGATARVHLAVSATTKACDIADITRQFEPFKYEAVVVTKLDETTRAGNVISVLSEKAKPVSFLTDGQRVPQDIERASKMRLLIHLEGFQVSRVELERRISKAS